MRKFLLFLTVSVAVFFTACSNDDIIGVDPGQSKTIQSKVVTTSSNGILPDSIYKTIMEENPNLYKFGESNSHLWVDEYENGLKSTSSTQKTIGYDSKITLKTWKNAFPWGLIHDSRVPANTTVYLAELVQYHKQITVPKGASVILPPKSYMETIVNMGRFPGGTATQNYHETGYEYRFVKSSSSGDTYDLVTECVQVEFNILGQWVFNPPVFVNANAKNPNTFEFKYQYSFNSWD